MSFDEILDLTDDVFLIYNIHTYSYQTVSSSGRKTASRERKLPEKIINEKIRTTHIPGI